jgi:hypothetical protein
MALVKNANTTEGATLRAPDEEEDARISRTTPPKR